MTEFMVIVFKYLVTGWVLMIPSNISNCFGVSF